MRLAAGWVDEKGAVIDPALNREWNQTTPRFVSSAAILLRFGRCPELLDTVRRAMTYSCSRLPETEVRESSPDFWMRELATAWYCLKPLVPPEESEAWRARLAAVEPENIYKFTDPAHKKLKEFHNWAVYSSGGESMRDSLGIGGGDFLWGNRFFDVYMAGQLHRLTPEGMYRDPGDPITYDIHPAADRQRAALRLPRRTFPDSRQFPENRRPDAAALPVAGRVRALRRPLGGHAVPGGDRGGAVRA